MIPNHQMNTNYSNQYIIDSSGPSPNTPTFQNQNFTYQTKPSQYAQARFIPPPSPGPGPGPGTGPQINAQIIPMQTSYQRPTPSSTPANIPLQQSPTSPSVSNYYPQYTPQYQNQYQPVQYHQSQIIQQNNFVPPQQQQHQMFQEQVRFNHMMPQQINPQINQSVNQNLPQQMYQYQAQKIVMTPRMNHPNQMPQMQDNLSHQQQMHNIQQQQQQQQSPINTNNLNQIKQAQINVNKNINNTTVTQMSSQIAPIQQIQQQPLQNVVNNNQICMTPTTTTLITNNNNNNNINNKSTVLIANSNKENENSKSETCLNDVECLYNKEISFLINLPLSVEEEEILSDYDSRLYGFLKLDSTEQIFKKYFLLKAINCYEKRVKLLENEALKLGELKSQVQQKILTLEPNDLIELNKKIKQNRIKQAKIYLSLGHFYLLVYDYLKSLQCYQKFSSFNVNKLKVIVNFIYSFKN
ncbi:unnamed protein product [Brachionus calyciflorus]|uniref:Uncharacterized protein n=1 Tax=Brachionus calyciflorus TaxID=104777 RepID=A0A813RLS9_9BILA|nr:unnamed protein product [Brachionus calyciflorus]